MANFLSSVNKQGDIVDQIIHFADGQKKTIRGVKSDTIEQGEFTKFLTEDGRLVMVNTKNVNLIEVFKVS